MTLKPSRSLQVSLLVALVAVAIGGAALLRGRSQLSPAPRLAMRPKLVEPNHWLVSTPDKAGYFAHMERVNSDIALKPKVEEKDRISELRIERLAEESPIYAAGFRKDDKIISVNDKPVETLTRAINLAHEIQMSVRLRVRVERHGKFIDYTFDFE